MFFSLPMAFFFFAIGYYSRNLLTKLRDMRYVYLIALSVSLLVAEVALALQCPTPNMAIPAFPAPHTFLPASFCGVGAVLCLSGKSFAAIRFIGRYSLYYFMMERWIRELWFGLSARLMPSLFARPDTDNPNLMSLSATQVTITMVVLILSGTALTPLLRSVISWMRRRIVATD